MSRQFQVYLLPADADNLVQTLRARIGVSLVESYSSRPVPQELESPVQRGGGMRKAYLSHLDCFLVPSKQADIRTLFVPVRSQWSVQTESEVIKFSGCEFDGSVLARGRFYFQNDPLAGDMIVPKKQEFLAWADKVFRVAKRSLYRSKTLDAYIGEGARMWQQKGGRFAWNNIGGQICEEEI